MIIKLYGAGENTCRCGSWLEHWKQYSGQRANYCVVRGCGGRPEAGGHVQETGTRDEDVHVIPLCRACNGKEGQDLVIFDGVNLVPLNVAKTCEREQRQERAVAGR